MRLLTCLIIPLAFVATLLSCTASERTPPPDMVLVPEGEFIMGSDKVDTEGLQQRYGLMKPLYVDEHPQQRVRLKSFFIDRYEVCNEQYKEFTGATKYQEPFEWSQNGYNLAAERLEKSDVDALRWIASDYFKEDVDTRRLDKPALLNLMTQKRQFLDRLPVAGVMWADADAYCHWKHKRLPSEAEWEKAARGKDGNEFPWGNTWDPDAINSGDNIQWEDGIAPVGTYPNSKSPYGVYDMAGNVWEWVADDYRPYPGNLTPNAEFGAGKKVLRGGGGGIGHYAISQFFRSAARQSNDPRATGADVGFRCAQDIR